MKQPGLEESLGKRILRFLRREKLVGACIVRDNVYKFWESNSHYIITGSDNGKPFKPVRGRKYKRIWTIRIEDLMKHSDNLEDFLHTEEYNNYLENKERLLTQSYSQAASPSSEHILSN